MARKVISTADIEINVIDTPGHTKDSISLVIENCLFTGDALFLDDGGAGRDDLPGGDPAQHWESLQKYPRRAIRYFFPAGNGQYLEKPGNPWVNRIRLDRSGCFHKPTNGR